MAEKYPMADGQHRHVLPISLFRRVGETVYIAGHGAVDAYGNFVGYTLESQMRYTMQQLEKTLTEAGVTFADVVMVRCYVQRWEDIPVYNQLYREYFHEPYPARTTITDCLPPGLMFEIDAVAVIGAGNTETE